MNSLVSVPARLGALTLTAVFLCPWVCTETRGAPPTAVGPALAVRVGWDGYGREGRWSPVQVTIDAVQDPAEGVLELTRGKRVVTATPVSLVPGSPKRFTLYLPLESADEFSSSVTVGVRLREGSRVLATAPAPARLVDAGSGLIVTATGEAAGLKAFNGMGVDELRLQRPRSQEQRYSERVVRVAHATPTSLPERWNGYDAVDLLVLTNTAWSAMSGRQRHAVRLWVESGGRAILCGDRVADWADAEGRRLTQRWWVPPSSREATEDRVAVANNSPFLPPPIPKPGEWLVARFLAVRPKRTDTPWLSSRPRIPPLARVGFGIVIWPRFDLFRSSVRSRRDYRALWRDIIEVATGAMADESRLATLSDVPAASRAASELPRLRAPSRALLVGIATAYALVFGPGLVFALRRLRRTVTAWLFLPSLSVAMTLLLLALGQSWARGQSVVNRVTVTEVMSGAATGWERCLAGLFSPTNRALAVEIRDPCARLHVSSAEETGMMASAGPNIGLPPTLQTDERSLWERLPVTLWSILSLQYARPIDLEGTVRVRLRERVTDRPEGEVRNETPHALGQAYLHYRGHRYVLGDLGRGAARAVSAAGWTRYSMAREEGEARFGASGSERQRRGPSPGPQTAYPGRGLASPSEPAGVPPGNSEQALYDDAPVLLRGSSGRDEAVMVARAPTLPAMLRVGGPSAGLSTSLGTGQVVEERSRASLLLVRAEVRR